VIVSNITGGECVREQNQAEYENKAKYQKEDTPLSASS